MIWQVVLKKIKKIAAARATPHLQVNAPLVQMWNSYITSFQLLYSQDFHKTWLLVT